VHALLGGAARDKVPAYYSATVMSPDETAAQVAEKQAQGFVRFQTKMGGRDFEEDLAAIRKVAEALKPGIRWAVDPNRGWTTGQAITGAGILSPPRAYIWRSRYYRI